MSDEKTKKSFSQRLSYIGECLKARDFKNPALRPAKIFLLSLGILIILCVSMLFIRIRSIEVTGDLSVFSEQQIVDAADIDFGDGMFLKLNVGRSIKDKLPMIERVRVRRNPFSGRLRITVELKRYEYFVEYGGRFFAVDDTLRVLDIRESRLELVSLGAKRLTLPKIEAPVLGEVLVFSDTLDILDENGKVAQKGEPEKKYEYVTQTLAFISEGEYFDRTGAVLLHEKFNIRIVLDSKYLVKIGKSASLQTKLEVADAIILEGSVSQGSAAEIDVRDPALASARVDGEIDIEALLLG